MAGEKGYGVSGVVRGASTNKGRRLSKGGVGGRGVAGVSVVALIVGCQRV